MAQWRASGVWLLVAMAVLSWLCGCLLATTRRCRDGTGRLKEERSFASESRLCRRVLGGSLPWIPPVGLGGGCGISLWQSNAAARGYLVRPLLRVVVSSPFYFCALRCDRLDVCL